MDTAQRYEFFATHEAHGHSPLYELLSHEIACDNQLLTLIDQLPVQKRQPNLILGAARYLGAEPSGFTDFKSWLLRHWPAVAETASARRTQTNEAARTAVLLPALARIPGPLALIEVGASAGLCLCPDRYSYRYDERVSIDPADGISGVVLDCTTSGNPPLPAELPNVVSRTGVDLNPLDVANADDMHWLESLIWPEQQPRRDRLRAAITIARTDPPRLLTGDLLDTIADLVAEVPSDVTPVVFGSAVLAYLTPTARLTFETTIRDLPCRWITNEGVGVIDSIAAQLPHSPNTTRGSFVLSLDGEPVAYVGPHGQSLDWIAAGHAIA